MTTETYVESLKQQILRANAAYRDGVPIMSDAAFDELCDQYKASVTSPEWKSFRDSLHEAAGKVKHPFIMGSLDKIKADDEEALRKFVSGIKDSVGLHISAKVDGISCRLHYDDGELVEAATRGDGYFGQAITQKIKTLSSIPKQLPDEFTGDIRGELVIYNEDFNEENFPGFANPRNATAGIINRKETTNEKQLACIKFVAYSILGDEYTKGDQFVLLEKLGFETPEAIIIMKNDIADLLKNDIGYFGKAVEILAEQSPYEIDGVVVSGFEYRNENEYRPDAQIAVKINQQKAVTKLIDIEWQGPSKDGRFVPVAVLEPVEIAGTVVSKASLHNADFLLNCENLKYGATVVVCKRGDIIPQIDEVLPD